VKENDTKPLSLNSRMATEIISQWIMLTMKIKIELRRNPNIGRTHTKELVVSMARQTVHPIPLTGFPINLIL
jgi:hypothetical protein